MSGSSSILVPWYSGKEGCPTVAHKVAVDHRRHIMSVTPWHLGSRNDKPLFTSTFLCSKYITENCMLMLMPTWNACCSGQMGHGTHTRGAIQVWSATSPPLLVIPLKNKSLPELKFENCYCRPPSHLAFSWEIPPVSGLSPDCLQTFPSGTNSRNVPQRNFQLRRVTPFNFLLVL